MMDKHMICTDGFENVVENGQATGFALLARLPYYRGLGLSMVEDVAVTVDGEKVPRDRVLVTVSTGTFTLDRMETEFDARWEFGEVATVTVLKDGGLSAGEHKLELMEQLRVSYMPFPISGKDAKVVRIG